MFGYRRVARIGLAVTLAMPLVGAVACGGSKEDVKRAQVKPGSMPDGGDWTGVYYDGVFGFLHMIQDGDGVSGKWRTAAGDKWGQLHGQANGDLLMYEWKETTIGMVGPNATSTGRGYFKYVVPSEENADHEIHGEWGLGQSNAGHSWKAIKQRNQRPDPNSVMPDETESQQGEVDGWDQSKPKSSGSSSEEEEWD